MSVKIIVFFTLVCAFVGSLNAFGVNVKPQLCPKVCQDFYSGVCATDGENYQEFQNECFLRKYNCNLQKNKPFVPTNIDMCRTELVDTLSNLMMNMGILDMNKPQCFKACIDLYDPRCISNGKYRISVSNPCYLDMINCVVGGSQNAFKVISNNNC